MWRWISWRVRMPTMWFVIALRLAGDHAGHAIFPLLHAINSLFMAPSSNKCSGSATTNSFTVSIGSSTSGVRHFWWSGYAWRRNNICPKRLADFREHCGTWNTMYFANNAASLTSMECIEVHSTCNYKREELNYVQWERIRNKKKRNKFMCWQKKYLLRTLWLGYLRWSSVNWTVNWWPLIRKLFSNTCCSSSTKSLKNSPASSGFDSP